MKQSQCEIFSADSSEWTVNFKGTWEEPLAPPASPLGHFLRVCSWPAAFPNTSTQLYRFFPYSSSLPNLYSSLALFRDQIPFCFLTLVSCSNLLYSQLSDENFQECGGYKNGILLSFSEYLLCTHSVSGTVPGAENTSVNKTDKDDQSY